MHYLRSLFLILFGSFHLSWSSQLSVSGSNSNENDYSLCASFDYRCGDQSYKIYYPFRVVARSAPFCGHPNFELSCTSDDKILIAHISDKTYQVISMDYDTQLLHVTELEFVDQSCVQTFTNTSINPSLFDYSSDDTNLTVFFNCLYGFPSLYGLRNITCSGSDPEHYSFYSMAAPMLDIWKACNSIAMIPINQSLVSGLTMNYDDYVGQFMETLKKGFGLTWKVGDEWCSKCTNSNGICWSDPDPRNSSGECYCGHGNTSKGGVCVPNETSKKKKKPQKIIATVAGVGGAFILGFCIVLFLYNRRKKQRQASSSNLLSQSSSSKRSSRKDLEFGQNSYNTHIFTYDELQEATNNFSESRELGDGGFGTVYKGKLHDGRTVAVKRLYENNYRRLEQFKNEVDILSRLRHPNLVSLYGCTSGRSRELLLVYEYIPNGTLADHLHGTLTSKELLPWPVRMSIAIETADALAYLHSVEPQIIHRDVKTTNILVDNNFHVKVADFGLSRLFPLDATHVSTAPQGTPGYVDPEYHQCFQLTDKSDVYSFGVVLVELISSKPAVDISRHRHEINLAHMAITKIQNGQIDQLVDPELGYQSDLEIASMINQVAELAFRCLQSDGEMRPGIKEVLEVLIGIECGGKKAEKDHAEVAEAQTKEETRLLKNVVPFSPDTVTEQWSSRSTTPNTSA